MNNIRDNRQASKDERFSETGREINKDIVAPEKILRTVSHRFKRESPLICRDRGRVYFLYLVFIESVTMVSRDPLDQSRLTKERPYARAN